MAVFYTQKDGCLENKILLGLNGGLCLLISIVAISPWVQNRKHKFFPFLLILYIFVCVFEQIQWVCFVLFLNSGHFIIYHSRVSSWKAGIAVSSSLMLNVIVGMLHVKKDLSLVKSVNKKIAVSVINECTTGPFKWKMP